LLDAGGKKEKILELFRLATLCQFLTSKAMLAVRPRCGNGTTDETCSAVDGLWDPGAPGSTAEVCECGKWAIPVAK